VSPKETLDDLSALGLRHVGASSWVSRVQPGGMRIEQYTLASDGNLDDVTQCPNVFMFHLMDFICKICSWFDDLCRFLTPSRLLLVPEYVYVRVLYQLYLFAMYVLVEYIFIYLSSAENSSSTTRARGYGIPIELFGPFVESCVTIMGQLISDFPNDNVPRWSLGARSNQCDDPDQLVYNP
jgi:hypothetical protein